MSYQKDPRPFFNIPLPQRYPGSTHFLFIKIILVAMVFGFFSGWVGSLVLETYFFPREQTLSFLPPLFSRESLSKEQPLPSISLLAAERRQVNWYYRSQKRTLPGGGKDLWYVPSTPEGKGVVLTSDGWIFVVGDVGKNLSPNEILISLFDGKKFESEKILYDSFLNLSFIKIPADNLSVAQFGELEKDNEMLYRILPDHSFEEYRASGMTRKDASSIILSSDKLQYFLSASGSLNASDIGSSFLNQEGEVIGVFYGEQEGKLVILPTLFLKGAISRLLQEEKITNVSFRFSYLPLEEISLSKNETNLSRGVLLVNSPEKPLAKSVLGKSVSEGDILVSIENISPSSKIPVEYLLRSFGKKTGDELKLKIFSKQFQEMKEIMLKFP